jgi:hypothetical protein
MSESKVILVTGASTIVVPGSFTSGTNHSPTPVTPPMKRSPPRTSSATAG